MRKVVLITGASSGIGLALCKRLLVENDELHLCLACRNVSKAEGVRASLLASHPTAEVTVVQVDVSNLESIFRASSELKQRFKRLDFVYLNAGIMPNPQLNLRALFSGLFSRRFSVHITFCGSSGILLYDNRMTLLKITNLSCLGHWAGLRNLGMCVCVSVPMCVWVWTSLENALRFYLTFTWTTQSTNSSSPGSLAHTCILLISIYLDRVIIHAGLYSSVVCPGTVLTNLTYGILPPFVWMLLIPIIWLLRFFANAFTLTPYNGTEALVWLFHQKPESLNPLIKYMSATTGFGSNYVTTQRMDLDEDTAEKFYQNLLELEKQVRVTIQKNDTSQ
uniref:3-keto-steroid reductase/17-beta-hydroxysteroid dehydrogenase 7 n=1 Tax=Otolemur garnettii TaxID=30611 RepID=H0X3V3_OTOGA